MGKSLRQLLNEFEFPEKDLNPRNVTPDMLKSKEQPQALTIIPKFTIPKGKLGWNTRELKDIEVKGLKVEGVKLPYDRQYTLLTNNIGEIYGADAPRILLRGTVDLNKATKKIVNRAAKIIAGPIGIFGKGNAVQSFVKNSISNLAATRQPSDVISGDSTENGLYASMIRGNVDNEKNPITSLLTQYRTPSQFKEAVGDFSNGEFKIGGAVTDLAVNTAYKSVGWAASKIGLGKQDSGKSNSLKKEIQNINDKKQFPMFPSFYTLKTFLEDKGQRALNGLPTPTGISQGSTQFSRNENFYTLYDKLETTLTLDGVSKFNPQEFDTVGNTIDKYKDTNPDEYEIFRTGSAVAAGYPGEILPSDLYGFGQNDSTSGPRSQTFTDGIYNPYKLFDAKRTNKAVELDGYLIVRDGKPDGENGVYKIPDIINTITPKRFSEKATTAILGLPNTKFFGGYKNRITQNQIKGDHRLKSYKALVNNAPDLVNIRFEYEGKPIYLLSNITSLTDTPTATWGDVKPIGSPYKFYFYESFEREISFKAQLYAVNEAEIKLVWEKANDIMKLTNAKKAGGSAGIQGKQCKLKIGSVIDCNFGFLSSCTLTVPDISPWEIQAGSQFPFVCELDITYKVIETQVDLDFYGGGVITPPPANYDDFPTDVKLPPLSFPKLPPPKVDMIKLSDRRNGLGLNMQEELIRQINILTEQSKEAEERRAMEELEQKAEAETAPERDADISKMVRGAIQTDDTNKVAQLDYTVPAEIEQGNTDYVNNIVKTSINSTTPSIPQITTTGGGATVTTTGGAPGGTTQLITAQNAIEGGSSNDVPGSSVRSGGGWWKRIFGAAEGDVVPGKYTHWDAAKGDHKKNIFGRYRLYNKNQF